MKPNSIIKKTFMLKTKLNISKQIDNIPICSNLELYIQEYDSFVPILRELQSKFQNKINDITLICLPHLDVDLYKGDEHKYAVKITDNKTEILLDDRKINTDKENIKLPLVLNNFIFDIFSLFENVKKIYYISDECNFHKGTCSEMYGLKEETTFTRNNKLKNIIRIDGGGFCCCYTETLSFYDIKKNKFIDTNDNDYLHEEDYDFY
jgi:hypothetical protein